MADKWLIISAEKSLRFTQVLGQGGGLEEEILARGHVLFTRRLDRLIGLQQSPWTTGQC